MTFTFKRKRQKMRERVGSDNRVVRDYFLTYLAGSNQAAPDPSVLQVKQGVGIVVGNQFADDFQATLRDVQIDRLETLPPFCKWECLLEFSTEAQLPSNDSQDPTQARVKRRITNREVTRYITANRGQNGNPPMLILNAAGQPPNGGVPIVDWYRTFEYEWYRNSPTQGFNGKINLNAFNGCNPGTLVCVIESEEYYEGSFYGWKEKIAMIFDPLGWPNPIVNAGLMQISYQNGAAASKLIPIKDGNGADIQEPVALYTQDYFISPGVPDPNRRKGTPISSADLLSTSPQYGGYIPIDYYNPAPFEAIGVQPFPAN